MNNTKPVKRTKIFYRDTTEGAKEYSLIVGGVKTQAQAEKLIKSERRTIGHSEDVIVRVEAA